jgi:hypothetical protein
MMRFKNLASLCAIATICSASSFVDGQEPVGSGLKSLLVRDASEQSIPSTSSKVPAKPASMTEGKPSSPKLNPVERKTIKENASAEGGEAHLLRYKFTAGTRVVGEVTHLAKTNTKIDTTEQDSNSRTVSQKNWDFVSVEKGKMTFEYRITSIDMSQRIGSAEELRYSSKDGEAPHPQFKSAADSIGRVISTVTIDEQGLIIARSDEINPPSLGMGDITLPLPEKAVAIGGSWECPREMRIRREDGSQKVVRFRELYKLDKVSLGIATVSVRSEMITIITDPKEEAQVLQQLSNGAVRFDMEAGRMIAKDLTWDKRVIDFAGPGSSMEYNSRLSEEVTKTESFTPPSRTARK